MKWSGKPIKLKVGDRVKSVRTGKIGYVTFIKEMGEDLNRLVGVADVPDGEKGWVHDEPSLEMFPLN